MSRPPLIALWSPAPGCGKTTAADYLYYFGYRRASFAAPLKDMLTVLMHNLGIRSLDIKDYLYGDRKQEPIPELGGKSARELAQTLGTEWGRDRVLRDLWVSCADRYIRTAQVPLVFDDMRFANEWDLIAEHHGEHWKIERPGKAPPNSHRSEGALAGHSFRKVFVNDWTVEGLQDKIKAYLA